MLARLLRKNLSDRKQAFCSSAALVVALAIPGMAGPAQAATLTFRQGANGYTGNQDCQIRMGGPDNDYSTTVYIYVYSNIQGLTRFDNIFGNGVNQIPPGSTITSARLEFVRVQSLGVTGVIDLHRMLADWNATSTWNSMNNGVQRDNIEASSTATVVGGGASFDVISDVQAWSLGANNRGWSMHLNPSSPENYYVYSADYFGLGERPQLTVTFEAPVVPVEAATWSSIKAVSR